MTDTESGDIDPELGHAHKLIVLCRLAELDIPTLKSHLRPVGVHANQIDKWLVGGAIVSKSRAKLRDYFNERHNIPIGLNVFDMNNVEFELYVSDNAPRWGRTQNGTSTSHSLAAHDRQLPDNIAKLLSRFAGCYQIIRPHSVYTDRYILEPLQIGTDALPVINMYSHHRPPELQWLYSGQGTASSRYCFVLLEREHESVVDLNAYRALAFYFGQEASPEYFSGVLIRGLTDAHLQLASMPFIALRVDDGEGLAEVDAQSATPLRGEPLLWRLRKDSALLLGTASAVKYPDVYKACHNLFEALKKSTERVRRASSDPDATESNALVLQTIKPSELDDRITLNEETWRDIVSVLDFS